MNRIIVIVCLLIALLAAPLWLLMAGFSPALFNGIDTAPLVKRLGAYGMFGLVWAIPVWVLYFLWRTIKTWGDAAETRNAILMAIPGLCLIGVILAINLAP